MYSSKYDVSTSTRSEERSDATRLSMRYKTLSQVESKNVHDQKDRSYVSPSCSDTSNWMEMNQVFVLTLFTCA